jgi:uncharacterized protein YciI
MTYAAVIYRRGVRWDAGFLRARYAEGALYCGGPFADDTGGVAIYRGEDFASIAALVATDPSVADGLLEPELHPMWLPFAAAPSG